MDENDILRKRKDIFSIDEQFNYENGLRYGNASSGDDGLNAVGVITPTQTICRFNDTTVNGLMGSGYHMDNYDDIILDIYGDEKVGQDIMMFFVNELNPKIHEYGGDYWISLFVPIPINSSQKKSLENLNKEIKDYEKRTGENILVGSVLRDYWTEPYETYPVKDSNNLDELLNKVIVDDDFIFPYEEENIIGYPNNENHYNDSNFKLSSQVGFKSKKR